MNRRDLLKLALCASALTLPIRHSTGGINQTREPLNWVDKDIYLNETLVIKDYDVIRHCMIRYNPNLDIVILIPATTKLYFIEYNIFHEESFEADFGQPIEHHSVAFGHTTFPKHVIFCAGESNG